MQLMNLLPPLIGFVGLLLAYFIYRKLIAVKVADADLNEIADEIHLGAMVFIRREYRVLFVFAAVIVILLWTFLGYKTVLAYIAGTLTSCAAGFFGMYSATKVNVRTTFAAHKYGAPEALSLAFLGGSVMGLCVAALGLLGLGLLYFYFGQNPESAHAIHGFGMGASTVALFSRVGGGIFTKSADVGADLVGKIEAGIPEDDPRNPGVIADNVGDNVGDIAGMGSDIFESYCGAMIATIAIASATPMAYLGEQSGLMFLPLALASLGLITSVIGIFLVKSFSHKKPAVALRVGTLSASLMFIAVSYFVITQSELNVVVWVCVLIGALGGVIIGITTEYYTAAKPVKQIVQSAETGSATVIITGISIGMQSVVIPVVSIAAIIFATTHLAGLYGVGIAAVGMLGTIGITMAIDAYGPIADNAGGIAEMAGLGHETREITDSLDALGNTTAAIGKGFAIGAAALAALAIIAAYVETMVSKYSSFTLELSEPTVLVGVLLGGMLPFFIASLTMTAVGDAAFDMIREIRRQFREIPGLLEGKAKPDTPRCVDIATTAALKKMLLPGAVAVMFPPLVGFTVGPMALGGLLAGALVTGVCLALMMANSGGAWDNAKKMIEQGAMGGKGSPAHTASVVGDTVGDPFKDTSGPSMNILINVMAIVSLVIAPLL